MNTKVYQKGQAGAAFGYIFLVLSSIGLLFAGIGFLNFMKSAAYGQNVYEGLREIALPVATYIGFLSLLGAISGWLLVRKKEVLKCNQCGVEVPDSQRGSYGG